MKGILVLMLISFTHPVKDVPPSFGKGYAITAEFDGQATFSDGTNWTFTDGTQVTYP